MEDKVLKVEDLGYKKLRVEDRALFEAHYDKMNDYWASSLCFTGMHAFSHSVIIYCKEMAGYIVGLAWDSTTSRFVLLPFLGYYRQESINDTMALVRKDLEALDIPLIMTDVSEWMRPYYEAIPGMGWNVINDRDLCDYIYQIEDFRKAMGTQETRYNYRYFIRRYEPRVELMSAGHKQDCIELLERVWCEERDCEECQYGCVKDTISCVMDNFNALNIDGIVVYIEEKIVAYCAVTCYNGLGIYQYKKTERGYRGINEYLHIQCLERFLKEADIINYSEDMGLEGLRKYKSRLAPYTLEPKYELQAK